MIRVMREAFWPVRVAPCATNDGLIIINMHPFLNDDVDDDDYKYLIL